MKANHVSRLRPFVVVKGAMVLTLSITELVAGQSGAIVAAITPVATKERLPMVMLDHDKTQSQAEDCLNYLRRCPTSIR